MGRLLLHSSEYAGSHDRHKTDRKITRKLATNVLNETQRSLAYPVDSQRFNQRRLPVSPHFQDIVIVMRNLPPNLSLMCQKLTLSRA